jgi:hypothetical protein
VLLDYKVVVELVRLLEPQGQFLLGLQMLEAVILHVDGYRDSLIKQLHRPALPYCLTTDFHKSQVHLAQLK